MNSCYECKYNLKCFCQKAKDIHGETMNISGHVACELFEFSPHNIRLKIPSTINSLMTGVSKAIRDINGVITLVYTDGNSESIVSEMTKKEFDTKETFELTGLIQSLARNTEA